MVKLSICIPYYETFELTKKLIETLMPQLTDETELILVDDGCHEMRYETLFNDKLIVYHNEENKGGAYSSNKCIELATGKYVALIDSDDMVSDDYVETLINAINNHDEDLIFMDWKDMATGITIHRPNNYAPWKCIYKREKMPRFVEGWIYSYDVPFQEEVNKLNLSKYYVDKVLYFYNSARPDNLTHKKAEIIARGE